MTSMDYRQAREVCETHAARFRWAMDALSDHRPWTAEDIDALDPQERAVCDQFVLRFSKLQDAIELS